MAVTFSQKKYGTVAIAGHVGCGHCHSLNNQVQDDSAGLSVVLSLFKEATNLSLKIKDFTFEGKNITCILENGGSATAVANRGITVHEKEIIKRIIGKEAVNTHSVVLEQFGRFYGQGVTEVPVATQTAIANAALDGFIKNYPDNFLSTTEDFEDNFGNIIGTVLNIDGVDVSILATVNATSGGIGPNEDLEGNSVEGAKGEIVRALNMDKLPTLIVEAMIGSAFSVGLTENTYFVRADEEDDNPYVRQAVQLACEKLNYPCKFHQGGMKRTVNALRNNTQKVGQSIVDLGQQLANAVTAKEKVDVIAQLAIVISQDCGGVSFMSNELHESIGGAGALMKTSAVLNLVVTEEYLANTSIPFLTDKELNEYVNISKETMKQLNSFADKATKHILQ